MKFVTCLLAAALLLAGAEASHAAVRQRPYDRLAPSEAPGPSQTARIGFTRSNTTALSIGGKAELNHAPKIGISAFFARPGNLSHLSELAPYAGERQASRQRLSHGQSVSLDHHREYGSADQRRRLGASPALTRALLRADLWENQAA